MTTLKKTLNILKHPVALLAIIASVFGMSYLLYIWFGYPRGVDAASHLFWLEAMTKFWPHFNWIHSWAGGMPLYLFYPILPYLIMSILYFITKLPLAIILTVSAISTVALVTVGIYLIIYRLTQSWLTALLAVFLYVSAPAAFSYPFAGGAYGRPFSLVFFALAIWSAIIFFQKVEEKKWSKAGYFFTVIFLGLSVISHPITGSMTFAIIFLLGLVIKLRVWEKIKLIFKIYIPATLLTAVFSFPFFLLRPKQVEIDVQGFLSKLIPIGWTKLVYLFDYSQEIWTTGHLRTLTPFLIPLSVILWIFALLFRRKELQIHKFKIRLLLLFSFLSLFFLFYAKCVVSFLFPLYSIFGAPGAAPLYLAFFLSLTIGILWPIVWKFKNLTIITALILIITIGFWAKIQFLEIKNIPKFNRVSQKEFKAPIHSITKEVIINESQLIRMVIKDKNQFNFRFGTADEASLAMWFNLEYPYIPQTRDYFIHAILNIDDYVYNYVSIWHWNKNYPETNFNMDWWAIRQFIVDKKGETKDKYYSQPSYQHLDSIYSHDIFEFKNATPILSATNAPSVLIIGKEKVSYDTIFRSLAQANLNSQHFIPVVGEEKIDSYSLSELKKFKAVLLYGYKWKNKKRAERLLSDYVEQGGGLYIEANRDESTEVLEIFPVLESANASFTKEWQLKEVEQSVVKGIDYDKFSEAVYDEKPWGMVQANQLKDDARPILYNFDQPIMVSEERGKGRIIWSGMNLPYHILMYKNEEEGKLLGQLLNWTIKKENKPIDLEKPVIDEDLVYETESYKAEFIHPEKRIVTIKKPASGILWKENYFQNWQARLNGQKLKIYQAGPKFMYVPLPEDTREGAQVILEYKKKFWPEKFSMIISLLTLIGLIIWLLEGKILKPRLIKFTKRISHAVKSIREKPFDWWQDDEE